MGRPRTDGSDPEPYSILLVFRNQKELVQKVYRWKESIAFGCGSTPELSTANTFSPLLVHEPKLTKVHPIFPCHVDAPASNPIHHFLHDSKRAVYNSVFVVAWNIPVVVVSTSTAIYLAGKLVGKYNNKLGTSLLTKYTIFGDRLNFLGCL